MTTKTPPKYVVKRPWLHTPDSDLYKELMDKGGKEDLRKYFPDIDDAPPWGLTGFIQNTNTGIEEGCVYFWIGSNKQTACQICHDPKLQTEIEHEAPLYSEELFDYMEVAFAIKVRSKRLALMFSYDFGYLPSIQPI